MHEEELADELKLREHSPFHSGLTSVAHKNNRDVCWVCFEPIGAKFVDVPMKAAWIRLCENRECEKLALKEPMGDYSPHDKSPRVQVPEKIRSSLERHAHKLPDAIKNIIRR